VALLITLLLLSLMGIIGMASLDTVTRDRQTAGNLKTAQSAFYAADAAVSGSLELVRTEVVGQSIAAGDCLGAPVPSGSLPNGTTYGPDSTAPDDQICMTGIAEACDELVASAEIGATVFRYSIWNLRTEGNGTAGSVSRIQAAARRCHAFGS
jgi:Tfp pilus assembly protein PilX